MTKDELRDVYRMFLADDSATESLGRSLAEVVKGCHKGVTVFLQGNLGMGKTTLSRGVMRGMGHDGAVKSPTYTIVEPYEHLEPVVYHFDLYRLGDPEELEYLGIRDYFGKRSLCLIEWAEKGQGILPSPDLRFLLELKDEGRQATLTSETSLGKELLESLRASGG
ncbi:tRNA (adenosine(37)-N6)-threonylcarbamoyltransferase complex ATPase subunit type 1 TsaE [Marinobacter sp. CHS3-4]|uniref:tRNA (adenosine(37)-N6)-threonylcarbamoyltransferase complex ATPase subunit type 1 TsaE n=1 Tax=Marinobacter sp. CHS3-4 TaxID=3045174 RepID=UPI0024B57540|nr:tRNA (adenosine(37)-N6)-threonylcarbamoyltransferase complex ATPase subunit type 1 TsaE [Marinobacter sp. CHS3-4]MDI9244869.1 tRNA (adenosine(37)-N6)-threonylcarbamoyltransferase complex ATPase subunit type 1 TsaE [Marinobacter sp. CHS3-4]